MGVENERGVTTTVTYLLGSSASQFERNKYHHHQAYSLLSTYIKKYHALHVIYHYSLTQKQKQTQTQTQTQKKKQSNLST